MGVKKMKFVVDTEGMDLTPPDKERPIQELVHVVLMNMLFAFGKSGLKKQDRKQYYEIVKIIDKASKEKAKEIELSDEQVGFLRKAQANCDMVPNRLLEQVEGLIDSIQDR